MINRYCLVLAIGSNANSNMQRTRADIEIPGVDNLELAKHIQDNLDFDQLILNAIMENQVLMGSCIFKDIENRKDTYL